MKAALFDLDGVLVPCIKERTFSVLYQLRRLCYTAVLMHSNIYRIRPVSYTHLDVYKRQQ